jgi:transposase
MEDIRWRETADQTPTAQLIQSPYDLEARYGTKRDMNWVGYKVHLSETCDEDHPHLITQVTTTLATTSDFVMGEPIEQDLADRDLLPGSHLVDSGYVVAELLVNGPRKHQIDVVGPPLGSSSRQHRENLGYDLHAFVIDWNTHSTLHLRFAQIWKQIRDALSCEYERYPTSYHRARRRYPPADSPNAADGSAGVD